MFGLIHVCAYMKFVNDLNHIVVCWFLDIATWPFASSHIYVLSSSVLCVVWADATTRRENIYLSTNSNTSGKVPNTQWFHRALRSLTRLG